MALCRRRIRLSQAEHAQAKREATAITRKRLSTILRTQAPAIYQEEYLEARMRAWFRQQKGK